MLRREAEESFVCRAVEHRGYSQLSGRRPMTDRNSSTDESTFPPDRQLRYGRTGPSTVSTVIRQSS